MSSASTWARLRSDDILEIDVKELLPDRSAGVPREHLTYLQGVLEDARGCLNRPERNAAEAINHIERGLREIARFIKA